MKQLYIFFITIMLVLSAKAQNKQETLNWLNTHRQYITIVEGSGITSREFTIEMTEDFIRVANKNNTKKFETKISWSEIKKSMVGLLDGNKGYITLNTAKEGYSAPFITIFLSDYVMEMRDHLTKMSSLNNADAEVVTLDMRK